MLPITDPSELAPADVYRQARLVAAKTSRGTDRSWYRDAFELPCQWHLWFDGGREVVSATFSRQDQAWRPGPTIALATLTTGDGVADLLSELLSPTFFGHRPKALGVILHVADEFALAGLVQPPEGASEADEDLEILRYNLMDDPREVLSDREISVETTAWRLLPFWGAASGQARCGAIALSRSREAFLHQLLEHGEEFRVPVRVAVTAAAVECLAALPLIEPSVQGGCLIVLLYQKFTAVFAISPAGELRSVRSLTHRGGGGVPVGLGDILSSMAVSAELALPGVAGAAPPKALLVSNNPAALQAVTRELEDYSRTRRPIELATIDLASHPAVAAIPGNRPEFLVYDPVRVELTRAGGCALAKTQTFPALWKNWVTKSSFFDTAKLDDIYPTLPDLRLLRLASALNILLALAFIVLGGYGAWAFFQASNHPAWSLTPTQSKRTQDVQTKLLVERDQIDVTSRLLLPRSRGWLTLEFLLQLFPEDSGVRLDSFNYGMDAGRAGPAAVKGKPPVATGLVRTWSFRGLAKPQAQELLSNLNSQRWISAFFDRVAKATGDVSYAPDPTRLLTVTLTQARNPKFSATADPAEAANNPTGSFPFTFEATITQTLTDKDALALPTQKPF